MVLTKAFLLVLGIGLVDYATSWEFSVLLFYIVPIFFATWRGGTSIGIVFAFLCGTTWFIANIHSAPRAK
jgi:hypothetical protein